MQYWWLVLGMCLLAGCQPGEPPPPPTAPVAADLSTWAVPELVQPERQAPRAHSARPTKVPAGAAEKVYDYTPGVTVEVPVALDQPLDIVLEAGEQVRQRPGAGKCVRAGTGSVMASGRMCLSRSRRLA